MTTRRAALKQESKPQNRCLLMRKALIARKSLMKMGRESASTNREMSELCLRSADPTLPVN